MRRFLIRRLAVPVLGLAMALGTTTPAYASEDAGMCSENHDRVTIPDKFPLDACFDGTTLFIKNGTRIPLSLTFVGNQVETPERYEHGGGGAGSFLMQVIRPGDFGRNPAINAPDFREGVFPPAYYVKVKVGAGEAKVSIAPASTDIQKTYVITEALYKYVPVGGLTGAAKALVDLVDELREVGDQHVKCLDRNNGWGDLGCTALLGRNVAFAFGRSALGFGSNVVQAMATLFDSANWAARSAGDRIDLKDGQLSFTIPAVKAPVEPPKANPDPPKEQPPAPQPPPDNNPGNGGGNGGGGNSNPQPPPPAQEEPVPQPKTATATVQNKHLEGANDLGEDSGPAYLSSSMQPRCASNGCKVADTDMVSGDTFTAICQDTGAMMTNQNENTSADDANPHRVDSDQWIKGKRNGHEGFISFIYVTPGSRSLDIPRC